MFIELLDNTVVTYGFIYALCLWTALANLTLISTCHVLFAVCDWIGV